MASFMRRAAFAASIFISTASAELLGTNFGVANVNKTFDYVVVGGGNGGLAIASRLSEDPSVSVAVVEAGSFYEITNGNISQLPSFDATFTGKDPDDYSPLIDWGFVTTPQAGLLNVPSHYARGKTLGGCSARNYMAYQRGTVGSFDKWAEAVGDNNYTWNNVLPYYQKSITFTPPNQSKRAANATPAYNATAIGNGSPVSVTFANYALAFSSYIQKGLSQIGIKPIDGLVSGNIIGNSYLTVTVNQTTGARESSETSFLRHAIGRTNFVVYVQTLAKKIIFNGTTATGVVVQSGNKCYNLMANKEVIVSAGVFQSPQLLMVSGVGPANTLKQYNIPVVSDRPGVGQNMWDHLLFGPSYRVNVITTSALGNPSFYYQAINDFNNFAGGILSSQGGDLLAFEKIPQADRSNFSTTTKQQLAQFPADWPEVEYLPVSAFFGYNYDLTADAPTDGYQYSTIAAALVAPISRGNVTISSADTNDPPVINPNWLTAQTDVEVAIAAFKRARALYTSPALKEITIGQEYFPGPQVQTDAQILHLIRQAANTVFHGACTCAMGKTSDPMAVVDSHARVIGTKNLRVVDASAFPILPPGHPMSTVYMLAEKIYADIKAGQ